MTLWPEKIPEPFVDLYAQFACRAFDQYYLETAREIVQCCPSGHILDIGCGPGYLPIQVARLSERVKVDGVDLSPKMIRLARMNAKAFNLETRLRFSVNDGNRLKGIPDESFDMVVSTGVFHSLKRPERFVNECHRVLKFGCEAWIFDPAQIVTSQALLLREVTKIPRKFIAFLGAVIFFRLLKPRRYSREEARAVVGRSRFSDQSICGIGYLKMKLKK